MKTSSSSTAKTAATNTNTSNLQRKKGSSSKEAKNVAAETLATASSSSMKTRGTKDDDEELILYENAKSVAGGPLPDIPPEHVNAGTILLFYQYKEPSWTSKQHKQVLKDVLALAKQHEITGRGRVAPEGLNCTLSGRPQQIRNFCLGLRAYDPLFMNTDFKLTDGIPMAQVFKSLSIRKTNELVAYGLAGESKAPSLSKFAGQHLTADEYHKAMQDTNTVIIDVRNAYESAIGNFSPPPGGAELIDPQMRNSIEFPKWLADERTQTKLNGKKVLMYCTGGIRCERATALVNQLSSVNPSFKPEAVFELQGGIERYLKTFPKGGYWKGKNYLFDRRMEQIPEQKSKIHVEQDIVSSNHAKCAVCRNPWTTYRGKFKCSQGLCGVPVIVCDDCKTVASSNPKQLLCELCIVGYKAPQLMPDLIGMKRKAEERNKGGNGNVQEETGNDDSNTNTLSRKKVKSDTSADNSAKISEDQQQQQQYHKNRFFLSKLPLTATKSKIADLLRPATITTLHWLTDKHTGAFYGSCIVGVSSETDAAAIMEASNNSGNSNNSHKTLKMDKKKIKISYCRHHQQKNKNDDATSPSWPPANLMDREYPPIGK